MRFRYLVHAILLSFVVLVIAAVPSRSQGEGLHTPGNGTSGQQSSVSVIPDPLSPSPQPFNVLHYDAYLDLTAAPSKNMSGRTQITVRWVKEPSEGPFIFHLRLDSLVIDSVLYDDQRITATEVGDPSLATYHFEVTPPSTAHSGDVAVVTVVYHGIMTDEYGPGQWGGVSSGGGVLYALGVGINNNYVSTTEHWLACYDHPSDKATFTGTFVVPSVMPEGTTNVPVNVALSDGWS